MEIKSILFVCLGNICRSPIAEGVAKRYIQEKNLDLIIFSMHFQRPFVVFDREGKSAPMGSRIDTLLKKFEFGNRKLNEIEKNGRFFDIHFEHVPAIMDAERGKFINYLKRIL